LSGQKQENDTGIHPLDSTADRNLGEPQPDLFGPKCREEVRHVRAYRTPVSPPRSTVYVSLDAALLYSLWLPKFP